jgi:hypothetical protein
MPRPTVATPAQVRETISSLLRETGITGSASAPSFRQAVSVRKVRERLGGGNPATIAHEINALEKDTVGAGIPNLSIPEVPADIAALMGQLWQAAVGIQLTEVLQLKSQAQGIADAANSALVEEKLRNQVLLQELAELRAAAAERDTQLAQVQVAKHGPGRAKRQDSKRVAGKRRAHVGIAGCPDSTGGRKDSRHRRRPRALTTASPNNFFKKLPNNARPIRQRSAA